MTRTVLSNGRVLTPAGIRDDLAVVIDAGVIAAIGPGLPADATHYDLGGKLLVPGLIDVQVNGGGGRLFNDDPSVEALAYMAAAHRRFGTSALLPTLITDDLDVVEQAIRAVDEAIASKVPGIVGIHLEGPFLSVRRKGAHRQDRLKVLEDRHLSLLTSLHNGVTHITVAPEAVSPDQIRFLAGHGVRISIGHTDAGYDAAKAILDAGATGFTHLFNAMSQLANRAPGVVGAALTSPSAFAGIIADGVHVHPAAIEVALRCLGPDRLMLVTDAMSLAGTDLDSFELQGRTINRIGNTLVTTDGTLAGSDLTMIEAVRRMTALGGVTLETAIAMASATPARFLGLADRIGVIGPGLRADLALLDEHLDVAAMWVGGQLMH